VKPPVYVKGVKPAYTADALRARIEGTVTLGVVVLPDGTVGDVTVPTSLGNALDLEAVKAARQWRFKPGTKDGRPVPVQVKLDFQFKSLGKPARRMGGRASGHRPATGNQEPR